MTRSLPDELTHLPTPAIIDELSSEAMLALKKQKLMAEFQARGIPYDVDQLDYDPAIVNLEVGAYSELLLRQDMNDALRAMLLAYASGADLDNLGGYFYDVVRLDGESDDAFAGRIILENRGRSTGGTKPRYEAIARAADVRVARAVAYREGKSPLIKMAIFSTDHNGVADDALLATVSEAVNTEAARMINDVIEVHRAVSAVLDVAFKVWLLPQASQTILEDLETRLRSTWERDVDLGFDITPSWLIAQLMIAGVQKIELVTPLLDVVVPPFETVALGNVTIDNMGRGY